MTSAAILAIILIGLTATSGWVITVNKESVTPHFTRNVILVCSNGNGDILSSDMGIVTVDRLRISKFNQNRWHSVASLGWHESSVKTSLTDAIVNGQVDTIGNSFLEATFEVATDQSIGQFLCEVDGLDAEKNVKVLKTLPVEVKEETTGYEILKTLLALKNKEKDNVNKMAAMMRNINDLYQTIANVSATQQQIIGSIEALAKGQIALKSVENMLGNEISQVQSNLSGLLEANKVDLNNFITNFTDKQNTATYERNQLSTTIANLTDQLATITTEMSDMSSTVANLTSCCSKKVKYCKRNKSNFSWPDGEYLLPQADTGCPNTPTTIWENSYINVSTGPSTDKKDATSRDLNLAGNVIEDDGGNSYMVLKSCRILSSAPDVEWPVGNYCIQAYKYNHQGFDDKYCPAKFHYGLIYFGRYDDGTDGDEVSNMDVGRGSSFTLVPFCCRQDGSADDPIQLPTLSPFYLYRHGGKCQQVDGMDVNEQWVLFGTGRWGWNNNYYSEADRVYVPDGIIDNTIGKNNTGVKIEMCYYTPSC